MAAQCPLSKLRVFSRAAAESWSEHESGSLMRSVCRISKEGKDGNLGPQAYRPTRKRDRVVRVSEPHCVASACSLSAAVLPCRTCIVTHSEWLPPLLTRTSLSPSPTRNSLRPPLPTPSRPTSASSGRLRTPRTRTRGRSTASTERPSSRSASARRRARTRTSSRSRLAVPSVSSTGVPVSQDAWLTKSFSW